VRIHFVSPGHNSAQWRLLACTDKSYFLDSFAFGGARKNDLPIDGQRADLSDESVDVCK